MEKRKAHYDLNEIKVIVAQRGMDAFTRAAQDNARLMGMNGQVALEVVLGLQRGMLFKSMTLMRIAAYGRMCITRPVQTGKPLISK